MRQHASGSGIVGKGRRRWRRSEWPLSGLAFLTVLLVTACGPLPRPFIHDAADGVPAPRVATAVLVAPVDGAPGLAEALARALADQDIVATPADALSGPAPAGALRLDGRIAAAGGTRSLLWSWQGPDGKPAGELRQTLPPGPIPAAELAPRAAAALGQALRGEDPATTVAAPKVPRVDVQPVQVIGRFDGAALTRAMAGALSRQMLAVVGRDHPDVVVQGQVSVGNGRDGNDPVEVTWVVRDAAGKELGTVSQGSPVPHELLMGDVSPLARQIAIAGADGVAEVIRKNQ